jgi:hypothetical protein
VTDEEELRDFTRSLFGRTAEPAEGTPARVPAEGGNPATSPTPDERMRTFTRALFGHQTTPERTTP